MKEEKRERRQEEEGSAAHPRQPQSLEETSGVQQSPPCHDQVMWVQTGGCWVTSSSSALGAFHPEADPFPGGWGGGKASSR